MPIIFTDLAEELLSRRPPMSAIPTRLAEAKQLLSACRWSLDIVPETNRTVYVAIDPTGTPRRSFVPVDRLYDYARGVFDAQEWD
jgi:hypothetical protein